ncbi:MAG: hypothetical protein LBU55_04705, partial [Elusimicrobiota bacterium]|nr:hypothetical protein [Elusimicrobiota bacterium]
MWSFVLILFSSLPLVYAVEADNYSTLKSLLADSQDYTQDNQNPIIVSTNITHDFLGSSTELIVSSVTKSVYGADNSITLLFKNASDRVINFSGAGTSVSFLNFKDIRFLDISRTTGNGAAFINRSSSKLFFINSCVTFMSNTAGRGAIENYSGGYIEFSSCTVQFALGTASDCGGAVYNNNSGATLLFNNSEVIFEWNKAAIGGAIYNFNMATINFENTFAGIMQSYASDCGGAISNANTATINFYNNGDIGFSFNTANNYGGAVVNTENSSIYSYNSNLSFSFNTAAKAGAFANYSYSTAVFSNSNLSFINNSASGDGGAINNYLSSMSFISSEILFYSNSAGSGGVIFNSDGNISFLSSIISFNENACTNVGSVIHNSDFGNILFEDSELLFEQNSGVYGTIHNGVSSVMTFSRSTVAFNSNSTSSNGAAMAINGAGGNSIIKFIDSSVDITHGVTHGVGGVAYICNNASLLFENSDATFFGNTAYGTGGGAIRSIVSSVLGFSVGSTITFTANVATSSGGAIGMSDRVSLNVSSSILLFNANTASTGEGGGIYSNSALSCLFSASTVNFVGNSAQSGGAISHWYSTTTFLNSNVTFHNNKAFASSGGAMRIENSNIVFTNSNVIFSENTAISRGGSLYLYKSTMSFNNSTVTFSGNSADSGGAIFLYSDDDRAFFNTGTLVTFSNNKDSLGSYQIYVATASATATNKLVQFNSGSIVEFKGNTASYGLTNVWERILWDPSEIRFTNNQMADGKAVSEAMSDFWTLISKSQNKSITAEGNVSTGGKGSVISLYGGYYAFSGPLNFIANTTLTGSNGGGAIYLTGTSNIAIDSTSFWSGNTASNGGAIYINTNDSGSGNLLFANTYSTFTLNKSGEIGGAIHNNGTLKFSQTSTVEFDANTAATSGGALSNHGTAELEGSTIFKNNKAANGGAIYNGNNMTLTGSATFANNTSSNFGGAIYNTGTLNINAASGKEIIFNENFAENGGADIWTTTALVFNGAGAVVFNSGIGGSGTIYKTGSGALYLGGNSSDFAGTYKQSAGKTLVSGTYFTGISSITNASILEFTGDQA